MNKWLDKNMVTLVNEIERDYAVGVELCRKHNVSALDYFKELEKNKFFSSSFLKPRLKDVYYFLILDRDIRGEGWV